MFKLVLEKAEEPEIKLPAFIGSLKKEESSRKTYTSALLTKAKPLTVWITTNSGKFFKRGAYQTTLPAPEKSICRSRSNSQNRTWNNGLVPNWERSKSRISPCLFNFYAGYILRNARMNDQKLKSRLRGEISITSDMQMTLLLWQKAKN